jgi:Cdc6-like AAA superfamily ATPase
VTPQRVLGACAGAETLLILDEFDRVVDEDTHRRVAELIKAFSDSRSRSKIVIVGVADSVRELVGEHSSLSRSLAQIKLDRMNREELADIIHRGEERTQLRFHESVTHRIVSLADGFPHFVHLIALYASLAGIQSLLEDGARSPGPVGEQEYRTGVEEALQNSEHTLAETYENAVVTTRRRSDIYELILQAIAMGEEPVAQVQDIARHASTLASRSLKPAQLSTALGKLARDDKGKALTKVRDGYHKYTNPLLRAYVRMVLDQRYQGQLKLPFFDVALST